MINRDLLQDKHKEIQEVFIYLPHFLERVENLFARVNNVNKNVGNTVKHLGNMRQRSVMNCDYIQSIHFILCVTHVSDS